MKLLPEGTQRRAVFEFFDRGLCYVCTLGDSHLTCSTYLGNKLKYGDARWYHELLAGFVDTLVFLGTLGNETDHCLKNADKE